MDLRYPSSLQKRYANTVFPDLPNELIVEILAKSDYETFNNLCREPEFRSYCAGNSIFSERLYEERSRLKFSPGLIEFKEQGTSWREFYNRMIYLIQNLANIEAVELAMKGKFMEIKVYYKLTGWSLHHRVADHVASKGDLNMLKWLNERGARPGTNGANWATARGHLDILKWLASLSPAILPDSIGSRLAEINHHKDVVEWLKTKGIYPSTR
ncbi:MAG: hypothetical protein Solivirus1_84 [Solivirus sp.]|uniref:Ankyrin repeat protein n=1 Tax=Solivirus sp. TaxID=2487772 RepID=A0A3G5AFH2_9VIRU|nr:MAG: hypothetical protein Solivirus1_84 [Solivirus sp.]